MHMTVEKSMTVMGMKGCILLRNIVLIFELTRNVFECVVYPVQR
jgi:hypothetical protein